MDPNRSTQFSIANLAKLEVPFVCSKTHELGDELVDSHSDQVHLHDWLELDDHCRFLADDCL
jgi:hypothetical protein